MKKTYRITPGVPLSFFGGMLAYTLLSQQITFTKEWLIDQSFLLIPTAIGCFLLWAMQAIKIEGEYITRVVLFVDSKRRHITDIISVKEEVEGKNAYKFKSIKVVFRDGYSFHIFWFSTKDMKDIMERIKKIKPNAVDVSVDSYIKKPY